MPLYIRIMRKSYNHIIFLSIFIIPYFLMVYNPRSEPIDTPKDVFTKMDRFLKIEAEADRFSGTIVIGTRDHLLYEKTFGIADRNWGIPMDPTYVFDIASVNKSMISALVMIAVEEGKLSLTSKLVDLLNNYSYSGTFSKSISLHQLLTHTSGLPDYDAVAPRLAANNFRALKRLHFTNQEYVDFISQLKPIDKPGKQFHYSNFAYHLVCIILEDTYKMSFSDLLKIKILRPLDMQNTYSTTDNAEIREHLAKGYLYANGRWQKAPFIDLTLGRRVFSTARDLYKWASAFNDETFFTRGSLDKITTNQLSHITDKFSYGYGWVVFKENEHFDMGDLHIDAPYIIHGGSTDGYKSMLININHGEWIISMLANSGNRTNELQLAQKIAQILNETR